MARNGQSRAAAQSKTFQEGNGGLVMLSKDKIAKSFNHLYVLQGGYEMEEETGSGTGNGNGNQPDPDDGQTALDHEISNRALQLIVQLPEKFEDKVLVLRTALYLVKKIYGT